MEVENDLEEEVNNEEDQTESELEEKYRIWKKNSPFLYDMIVTNLLEWPSLTCYSIEGKGYTESQMVLGTHTSDGSQNYLMIDTELSARHYDEEKEEVGKYGGYDSKFKITVKINHDGEVNRARVMPQDEFFVATKTTQGKVCIFDVSKHPSTPVDTSICCPNMVLEGHTQEGYGVDWNPNEKGVLVSSSDDSSVCVFDVKSNKSDPLFNIKAHESVVSEVEWHRQDAKVFGSVGEDNFFKIWDLRTISTPMVNIKASMDDVNTLSFSSYNYNLVLTGGSNSILKLWDLRSINKPLHNFEGHHGNIVQVQWCPQDEAIFSSSGEDKRVILWDIAKIGEAQSEEDAEDGVPELLFTHGGHTGSISDIAWNKNDPMTIASVSDDNILHVWEPSESILKEESLFDIVTRLKPSDITVDKEAIKCN